MIRIVSYTQDGKKDNEWKIEYDNANRVIRVRSASEFGFTDYVMKYNADGLLDLYTEIYNGKEKEGETKYSYDNSKRLIQTGYRASSNYADTTQYWYRDYEKLFYRSHLKYPQPEGSGKRIAHEFLVYKVEIHE